MEPLLKRLLDYYHLDEHQYELLSKPVTIDNFADGHYFENMDEATELLKSSIASNEKIYIYGDYDADGVISISILVNMFKYLHYPVSYYVPSRYLDGYGLTKEKVEAIANQGYQLIITVDNGITAFEAISYAKQRGLKVLVIDHHQAEDHLPNADIILHPFVSHFGEVATSAGFVTFMFASAYLNKFDFYLATLAGISIVSDMMPIVQYNRNLLRLIIENYQDNNYINIDLLKEKDLFNEVSIGMRIAPKINAMGRLIEDSEDLGKVIEFLSSDDLDLLLKHNAWINEINNQRKEIMKNASENLDNIDVNESAIVAVVNEKEGIIGLIANSFLKKYHKPTIIFAQDQSGLFYKGSSRSPKQFNTVDAFKKLDYLLENCGGHAMAAGCTIKKENFELFKKQFIALAAKTSFEEEEEEAIPLYINEISFDSFEIINSFSPFGESWPAPKFLLSHIKVSSLMYSRDGKHIITSLGNNSKISGFYFSKQEMEKYQYVDMIGTLRLSSFLGRKTVEFVASEVFESKKRS